VSDDDLSIVQPLLYMKNVLITQEERVISLERTITYQRKEKKKEKEKNVEDDARNIHV
jgi:hypothetical protein